MRSLERLHALAETFVDWQLAEHPVWSSDVGRHDADDRLADMSRDAVARRSARLADFHREFQALPRPGDDAEAEADFDVFEAALERVRFNDEVLRPERRDPQCWVDECTGGVFALLKKDYAPAAVRARAATARLSAMPDLLDQARESLDDAVPIYADLAAEAAGGAGPLFNESLEALADGTPEADLIAMRGARDTALDALERFAGWLKEKRSSMTGKLPMGHEAYSRFLSRVLLLPLTPDQVVSLGEAELVRSRASEAWLEGEAARTVKPPVPRDQDEFLRQYEAHTEGIVRFLKEREVVTVPDHIGPFMCRQLPDAFRPTAPGGFMCPPGVFDPDPSGFYFIPAFDPDSGNFFFRWALEDPRPILAHEGVPGHHFQISLANRLGNPVRRYHDDGVFIEGWAFYTEEMLERCGMYNDRPDTRLQVMQLLRMRAARVPVDVRLATGEWTFEDAIGYFMKEGGLDSLAARGEASGAAAWPGYKINYLIGKWQIERLLGRVRAREGESFSLRRFHDRLLSYGSIPVAVIERLMLGSGGSVRDQ